MDARVTHIWTWLAHELTTSRTSLAVSILAFLVAVWSGYQAKRNASAVVTQARVAGAQLEQSLTASSEAKRAAEEARMISLHDVNAQTTERAARVVIGVEELKWPPILLKDPYGLTSYPRLAEPGQPKHVNYRRDRFDELYFWVRGVVLNGDIRPIQFIPYRGVELIEGKSGLLGDGEIRIPPKLHPVEGRYLLAPGEAALIEWRATRTIRQWIEIYNETKEAQPPSAGILVFPAGDPETASYIAIQLEVCPLRNDDTDDENWEIEDLLPGYAHVKPPKIVLPKALRQLALALDESTRKDPRTWDLEPWERDFLDLW
jgi:hypothetical protein